MAPLAGFFLCPFLPPLRFKRNHQTQKLKPHFHSENKAFLFFFLFFVFIYRSMERELSPPPFDRELSPPLFDDDDDDDEVFPTYLNMPEPLTLTKQQYQATYEAAKKAYGKGNTSGKPANEKKPPMPPKKKSAAKRIKKSRM